MNANRPDVSFFGEDVRIPIKHVIHAGADIRINDELIVKPNVYHFEQGPFNETGFGVLGAYRNNEHHEIQGGVFGKAGKAMVVYAGYQIDRFLVGMSYDVMTGQVREAGKGYGAFELSLTWTPRAKEKAPKPIEEKKKEQARKVEPRKTETKKKDVAVIEKPKPVAVDSVSNPKSVVNPVVHPKAPITQIKQQPIIEATPTVEAPKPAPTVMVEEVKPETSVVAPIEVVEPVKATVVEPVKEMPVKITPTIEVVEQPIETVVDNTKVEAENEAPTVNTTPTPVVEQETKTVVSSVNETKTEEAVIE
ncbi:MAG: type IX secretion system membrane protein PorP/SprF, partial [Bacteroidota bacterium]